MTKQHNIKTPLPAAEQDVTSHRSSFLRNVALTLPTVLVIAGVAYCLHMNQLLDKQLNTLTSDNIVLKQQQTDSRNQFNSTLEEMDLNQKKMVTQLDVVNKTLSQALQERWYQNSDWLLLKSRYYLDLAQINAHWSDNVKTSLALIQQADSLLANINDPSLYTIRQAIANERAQLQSIPAIDIAGLLAKLDALQQVLIQAPIKNPFTLIKNNPSVAASSDWRQHLQNSLQLFTKLVLIRHHDESIQPLIAPEYESLIRESILLNFQEAQWAIIQHNSDVYELSLAQAIHTIERSFEQKATNTQSLLKQLHELQQTPVVSKQQTIGESLRLLTQLIESKKNPSPVVPTTDSSTVVTPIAREPS